MVENSKDRIKSGHERGRNVQLGISFILIGVALIIAINDLLDLGSVGAYFTWESVLMFIGLILFIGRSYLGGFLCILGGGWFMIDDISYMVPPIVKTIYWPSALILLGVGMIIGSFVRRCRRSGTD